MTCRIILILLVLCQLVGSSEKGTKMNSTTILLVLSNTTSTSLNSSAVYVPHRPYYSATLLSMMQVTNKLIFVVSILAIITNSLLILVIWLDPLKKLRKSKPNVIIVNIALSDFLTGGASIFYLFPGNPEMFRIVFDIMSVGYTVSLFTLLIFTLERYIATLYPLKIKQLVTFKKTYVVCFAAWLAGAIVGTNGLYFEPEPSIVLEKLRIARITLLEVTVLAMMVLNVCIIVTIRRHSNRFKVGRTSQSIQRKQRQLNAVLTSLIILFILTALPFLVVTQMYHIIALSGPLNGSLLHHFVRVFPRLFMPFGLLNYVLNPIIYAWRLYDYRASVTALFKRKRRFNHHGLQVFNDHDQIDVAGQPRNEEQSHVINNGTDSHSFLKYTSHSES